MAYSTTIGDSQPTAKVCATSALPISIVTYAALASATSALNDSNVSGKQKGSMYAYEVSAGVMEVVMAAGSATTDKWVRLSPQGATAALTLTTTAMTDTAAHLATQFNRVENAINAILDGNVITPS